MERSFRAEESEAEPITDKETHAEADEGQRDVHEQGRDDPAVAQELSRE